MNNFIDYKKFPSENSASDLILLLEKNKIIFEVEDRSLRFNLIDDPTDDFFIVKIKLKDFKIVDELVQIQNESDIELLGEEHYLHTFSDDDILDAIANPEDWNKAELKLANTIAQQRKINISEKKINELKQINIKENKKKSSKLLKNTSNWLLIIAVFSVINSFFLVAQVPIKFTIGLGATEFVNGVILGLTGKLGILSIIITILISFIYVILWYLARKKIESALIAGIIFYAIDAIMLLVFKDFISVAIHIVIIVFVSIGYIKIKKNKLRKREVEGRE